MAVNVAVNAARGIRRAPDGKLAEEAARAFALLRPMVTRWFRKQARDLPWRRAAGGAGPVYLRRDPYATWISEIMLQQTQVAAAVPFYERWMRRFPDVAALSRASEADVLRAWAGLGYYARARNLRRAAQRVASSGFPRDWQGWRGLPGIGDYTAGAVASLALDQPHPILDGNVARVFSRWLGLGFRPDGGAARRAYWDLAERWVRGRQPGEANEALMEFGALVCTPAAPACAICPVAAHCRAQQRGWQLRLPPPKPRPAAEAVQGTALVASRAGRIGMELRPRGGFLADHFAFPLFWSTDGDWAVQCAARYPGLKSKTDAKPLGVVRHTIMHRHYALTVLRCEYAVSRGKPPPWRWFSAAGLEARLTNALTRKIWRAAAR